MEWWHRVKNHKAVVVALWIAGAVGGLGVFFGGINSIVEFVGLGWFDSADGWIASTYRKLTGWLAVEVSLPIWSLLPVIALASLPVAQRIQSSYRERVQPPATLAPVVPLLNADQRRVLQTISAEIEKQRGFPSFADLKKETGFTHLVTEGAIDVLLGEGLIRWDWDRMDILRASLTPAGRAYLLSPEISSEYWNN